MAQVRLIIGATRQLSKQVLAAVVMSVKNSVRFKGKQALQETVGFCFLMEQALDFLIDIVVSLPCTAKPLFFDTHNQYLSS